MRKFKMVFYPIYILTIILVVVMSFNISEALHLLQQWGWFKYFSDLPVMGRNLLLFMSSLMAIELLIQRAQIFRLKKASQTA